MLGLGSNINIGHPCQPFKVPPRLEKQVIGSGVRFSDETREIGTINAGRLEGRWKSVSCEYWTTVRERFYLMTLSLSQHEGLPP